MRKEDCQLGLPVIFGRENGQKTRGFIVKLNNKTAKVRTRESRGRRSESGTDWSVGYSLIQPDPHDSEIVDFEQRRRRRRRRNSRPAQNNFNEPSIETRVAAIVYCPFNYIENHAMEGVVACYSALSPENLTCDGELSRSQWVPKSRKLNKQLKGFFEVIGHQIDESLAYNWAEQKRQWEKTQEEIKNRSA